MTPTIGPVTSRFGRVRCAGAPAVLLAAILALAGCGNTPRLIGIASGVAAGGATANPAIGFTVGVAADAAANAGVLYVGRTRQQAEQDAIAAAAGGLDVGGAAPWQVRHDLPFGNEHGDLRVVRVLDNPLAPCKEIMFSVADGKGAQSSARWYTADICRQAQTWKWADAEPAVARWGFLQ